MTNAASPANRDTRPKLMTTVAAATYLSVDPSTLRRWITDGRLPAVKVGRDYRIAPADLDALLAVSSTSRPLALPPGGLS